MGTVRGNGGEKELLSSIYTFMKRLEFLTK